MRPSIYRWDHSPAQHFGQIAYDYLASKITDWGNCPDDDDGIAEQRAWRNSRVLYALLDGAPEYRPRKQGAPKDEAREEAVMLGGERVAWHRSLPELKCWAGQMTLASIVGARASALRDASEPGESSLLDWQVPLKTCSGIDARVAPNALDDGFSVAELGISVYTYAACELLAVLGMAIAPIIRYGYRCYGYVDAQGQWWQFKIVERQGYHRCYTMAKKVSVNGGP